MTLRFGTPDELLYGEPMTDEELRQLLDDMCDRIEAAARRKGFKDFPYRNRKETNHDL